VVAALVLARKGEVAFSGGSGQWSGVFDQAWGAAHSARPTATHCPLLESPGSPHQAQTPREAHWPQ
jgi:hypothetical protein